MSFLSRVFGSSPLKLSQNLGAYPLPNGDIGPLQVLLGVTNRGDSPVGISSVHITPKGTSEPLDAHLEGDVPTEIPPASDIRFEVRAKALAEASRSAGYTGTPKLSFVVTDSDGREYHHDFRLRVDEYIALKDE